MKYGFVPTPSQKCFRFFAKLFVFVFRLNTNTPLAVEIAQAINPIVESTFEGQRNTFVSGHGRLVWRARHSYQDEPLLCQIISKLNSEDVFLDIGANVGTFSIPASRKAKSVICIESDPINYGLLYQNVVINGVQDKVIIIPTFLGRHTGCFPITYRDVSKGDALSAFGQTLKLPTHSPNLHTIRQGVMTLDDLYGNYELELPTVVKIDVDGNEEFLLADKNQVLKQAKLIYIELSGLPHDKKVVDNLTLWGFRLSNSMEQNGPTAITPKGTVQIYSKL